MYAHAPGGGAFLQEAGAVVSRERSAAIEIDLRSNGSHRFACAGASSSMPENFVKKWTGKDTNDGEGDFHSRQL
jgi:hypothetical protein